MSIVLMLSKCVGVSISVVTRLAYLFQARLITQCRRCSSVYHRCKVQTKHICPRNLPGAIQMFPGRLVMVIVVAIYKKRVAQNCTCTLSYSFLNMSHKRQQLCIRVALQTWTSLQTMSFIQIRSKKLRHRLTLLRTLYFWIQLWVGNPLRVCTSVPHSICRVQHALVLNYYSTLVLQAIPAPGSKSTLQVLRVKHPLCGAKFQL